MLQIARQMTQANGLLHAPCVLIRFFERIRPNRNLEQSVVSAPFGPLQRRNRVAESCRSRETQ